MLGKKDIKVGALIWWDNGRSSHPCVITRVSKRGFSMKSFYDFKITNWYDNAINYTVCRCLRLSSKAEVKRYCKVVKKELDNRLKDLGKELADIRNEKDRYERLADEFISTF